MFVEHHLEKFLTVQAGTYVRKSFTFMTIHLGNVIILLINPEVD